MEIVVDEVAGVVTLVGSTIAPGLALRDVRFPYADYGGSRDKALAAARQWRDALVADLAPRPASSFTTS